MPVAKGDQIYINPDTLDKTQEVEWSQKMQHRSGEYIVSRYSNKTRAGEDENEGNIYIQRDMLNQLKAKSQGDAFTMTVDDSFQYGQSNKDGHLRWLIFHDKGRRPYQHRFIEGTITKFGNAAAGFVDRLGYGQITIMGDSVKLMFGDYLHDF